MTDGIVGLDHVQLTAPPGCEEEARRFYGGLLGLPEIPKPGMLAATGGVWFALGSQELHVGVEERFTAGPKAHPAFRLSHVGALEELAGRLRAAGAPVEPDERLPEHRRFYTRDPWGNRLELLARISPPS